MDTAITEYNATETALVELRKQYGATQWVVDTPDRMAGAKKARAEIRKWRLDLEAERKKIKAPALDRCRAIDAEAKRITIELLSLERPIDEAIKTVEQAKKREEEERKRAEEERTTKCRAEIDRIRNVPVGLVGDSIDAIHSAAEDLKALDLSWLAEFMGVAASARDDSVTKLRTMYSEAKSREDEQARLATERAELDRLRAEQAERDRIEREKRETEERERRAKLEAEEKAARDRIAEEEHQARVARETADTEARQLRAAQEADARKVREAEEERLRIEAERLQKERAVKEAKEREAQRQRDMCMDARSMLATFVQRYGKMAEFEKLASLINNFLEATDAC